LYNCKIDTTLNDATIVSPAWLTIDEFFYAGNNYFNPMYLAADQDFDPVAAGV
jgi:hypothetical protein